MKSVRKKTDFGALCVALFTRAWIEIARFAECMNFAVVALFTRAWIEIA